MNKNINAKVAMYQRVLAFLQNNEALWNDKPAFLAASTYLSDALAHLETELVARNTPINDYAEKKRRVREKLTETTNGISKLMVAYAVAIDNPRLEQRYSNSSSKLIKLSEEDFKQYLVLLQADLEEHAEGLANYGITATVMSDLNAQSSEWVTLIQAPRNAINERKQKGFEVKELVKEIGNYIIKTVDNLMGPLEHTHPELFFTYSSSARMVLESHRHRHDGEEDNGANQPVDEHPF